MIDMIEILQHRECCDLRRHSCEEAPRLLRIVAYHHELVIQLREYSLNSLSETLIRPRRRSPILLVQPIRHLKRNVRRLKEVQLHRSAKISFVSKYHAVVVFPLHIFQIVQVVDIGRSHIIRVYNPSHTAQCMKLISVIMHVLRGAIAPGWGTVDVTPSHSTTISPGILADLYRLGVYTEYILASINAARNCLTDTLAELTCQLTTLIELTTRNQIRDDSRALLVQAVEQIVLAIHAESLGRYGKSDDFQVGKGGDYASTRDISLLVYLISCKFLAYLKNVSELCNEVVHTYDNSTYWFGHR